MRSYTLKASIALLLIGSLATAFAAVDTKKSDEFFENAIEQLRNDEVNGAVIQFRNALQQNPQNLAARIKLGELLLVNDQPLAAIKELETAQSMGGDENLILVPLAKAYMKIAKPEQVLTGIIASGHEPEVDAELKLVQADAYMQLGSAKEAEKLYLDASVLAPVDPRPLLGLAKIELQKGRREKADKLLDQAVGLAPDNFDVLLFKALTHRDFGQYEQALSAFTQAIELFPSSVRALTGRAALWMDVGDYEKARKDIETARNFDRDSLETIYLRALLLFADGKSEEARAALSDSANEIRAIKDTYHAKLPNTILMLGVVAFFNESFDEAITHFNSFLKSQPRHAGVKRYLASAYLAKQEWTSIKKLLTPRAGERLIDPFALAILAEAHRATGDHRAAERHYAAAMELAPNVAGIGVRLAETRLDSGRPEKAIRELESLLEQFPDMMEPHAQITRVYLKTGDRVKALAAAETLIEKFPAESRAHIVASGVYLAYGDRIKARRHLEQASLLDPERLQPMVNLARLARMEGHIDSAEAQYRYTLERFPNAVGVQIELCELLFQKGDMEELGTRIAEVLATDPKNIKAHDLNIRSLLISGAEPTEIREKLFNFYQAFPENAEVSLIVGNGYRSLGDIDDAKLSFRRAVENAQFNGELLSRAANQQVGIGDLNGALWTLTKAKQASPDDKQIAMTHAAVLFQLKDFDRAADEITRLFEKHGESPELYVLQGDFLMARKQIEEAIDSYQTAREMLPNKKTTDVLVRALQRNNDLAGATQVLKPWIAKNPQDYRARRHYTEVLMSQQLWDQAKTELEALQQEGIEDIYILNNLATVYQRLNDPRALPAAELLFERAPENAAVLDTYGWILTQNGRVEEGLAMLREAYARVSTQPEIRFHIGKALASLGKKDAALEEFRAALDMDNSFADRAEAAQLLKELEKN